MYNLSRLKVLKALRKCVARRTTQSNSTPCAAKAPELEGLYCIKRVRLISATINRNFRGKYTALVMLHCTSLSLLA